MSNTGGPLMLMLWQFYCYVGGITGTGHQYFPWIHVNDLVGIYRFALENDNVKGILNAVSPEMVTNAEFCYTLGKVINRPVLFNQPAWLVKAMLGTERANMILESQKIQPKRTLDYGYKFKFPNLQAALVDIVNRK